MGTVILFVPKDRGLQPEGRLPSRGVAGSGFPPLTNIENKSPRQVGRIAVNLGIHQITQTYGSPGDRYRDTDPVERPDVGHFVFSGKKP